MKKKIVVHAFWMLWVNAITKVFWLSQETRAQRRLIGTFSICASLIIGFIKGTTIPGVHVRNAKTLT